MGFLVNSETRHTLIFIIKFDTHALLPERFPSKMFCTHASAPRAHTRNRNAAQKSPLHACLEDRGECLAPFFSRSVDGVGIGTLYDEMLRATPDLPLVAPCKGRLVYLDASRPPDLAVAVGGGSFTVLNEFLLNARTSRRLTRDRGLTGYTAHIAPCTQIFTPHAQALDHCPPPVIKSRPPRPPAPP